MAIGKYRLDVVYSLGRDIDDEIRAIVGKLEWASGGGLGDRDLNFDFANEWRRHLAVKKLEKAAIPGVEWQEYTATED